MSIITFDDGSTMDEKDMYEEIVEALESMKVKRNWEQLCS